MKGQKLTPKTKLRILQALRSANSSQYDKILSRLPPKKLKWIISLIRNGKSYKLKGRDQKSLKSLYKKHGQIARELSKRIKVNKKRQIARTQGSGLITGNY